MEKNNTWFQKEILKDKQDLLQHKRTLIKQIKKRGINGILQRPKLKSTIPNKNTIWKKIRKFLNF